MFLRLYRTQSIAETTMGRLYVDGQYYCDTIENAEKQIPTGHYPIRMTMSPKFGEVLPLIDRVIGRSGIRIHPGNTYRDSTGCILVGQADDRTLTLNEQPDGLAERKQSLLIERPDGPQVPRLMSSRKTFDPLCESMRVVASHGEEIWIEIVDATPEKLMQDKLYDEATRSMKNVDDYTWVSIPEEVIDLLRLQGKWDVTPTWQEQR